MKNLPVFSVGTASFLSSNASLAQSGNMMDGGMWGGSWMGGWILAADCALHCRYRPRSMDHHKKIKVTLMSKSATVLTIQKLMKFSSNRARLKMHRTDTFTQLAFSNIY